MPSKSSRILIKLFDCSFKLPWEHKQRLILMLRMLLRRSSLIFCPVFPGKNVLPQSDGSLVSCLRKALEVESLCKRKLDHFYEPPVILWDGHYHLATQKQNQKNTAEFLYQIFIVFGDNMEFLDHIGCVDISGVQLIALQDSGAASKFLGEFMNQKAGVKSLIAGW